MTAAGRDRGRPGRDPPQRAPAQGAHRHAADGRGQGRRLRPRAGGVRAGSPRGRAPTGWASPPSTRRSRCARPATPDRVLCWLTVPGDDWGAAIERDVDVTAYSVAELDAIAGHRPAGAGAAQGRHRPAPRRRAARRPGPTCSRRRRAGEDRESWTGHRHLVALLLQRRARRPGQRRAGAAVPRGASTLARAPGWSPRCAHLANSAAAILRPSSRLDLVRVRHRVVRPRPGARRDTGDLGPAPGDDGPGHAWPWSSTSRRATRSPTAAPGSADHATTLGLVPVGYADGLPRVGGNRAEVQVGGPAAQDPRPDLHGPARRRPRRRRPRSRCGRDASSAPASTASPPPQDWAEACGTISYEIVTRIGGRFTRRYVDSGRHRDDRAMSARRRILGAAAGAVGLAAAGAAIGIRRQSRAIGRREGDGTPFGSLHSAPMTVIADDGVPLARRGRRARPRPAAAGPARSPSSSATATPSTSTAGTSSARPTAAWSARSTTTSARTAAPGARPTGHATIEQLGHDLRTVLDHVVPEGPVVLVGHSMGGMTIVALAEQHPELIGDRVVGVGLISTTAGGLDPSRILLPMLPAKLGGRADPAAPSGPWPAATASSTASDGSAGRSPRVATDLFAFGDEVPAAYVDFVDSMLSQTPFEVVADFFPSFNGLDKFDAVEVLGRVPTTIICGTADRLTSIGHSRKLHERIPGSTLLECEDAGHMVHPRAARPGQRRARPAALGGRRAGRPAVSLRSASRSSRSARRRRRPCTRSCTRRSRPGRRSTRRPPR